MIFNKKLSIFLLTALILPLSAIDKNAGTSGFQFLKMHYSARALGMANAFTGMKNDVDVVYFNPAGLAQQNEKSLKSNYINYVDGMNGGSFAFVMPYQREVKVGFFAQYLNSGTMKRTSVLNDGSYSIDGEFSASDLIAGISLARKFKDNLDLGVNAKFISENLDDASASAVVIDLGLTHQTNNKNLVIGACVRNLGVQLSYYTEDEIKEKMPTVFSVGGNYTFNEKFRANLDLVKPIDNDFYGKLGFEYDLVPLMSLRAGFDSRSSDYKAGDTYEAMSGISAGFGIHYKRYSLDYGVASMGDLGWNNQISIGYRL